MISLETDIFCKVLNWKVSQLLDPQICGAKDIQLGSL